MSRASPRDPVLLALLVCAAIYVFWDCARPFDQADEFWYGEVVAGMLERGDYVTPRLGPRRDFTKPPVFFYLSLPAAALLPSFQQAMRLVPGLCFLAALILVYRLAYPAVGRTGARLAAAVFLLGYDQLHLHGFRAGVIEGLLALEMTWVLALNLRLRHQPQHVRWIGLALGLTFMTKTAFVVFPLGVTAANLWLQRGSLRLARRHVLQGLAAAALVIVPWFAASCAVNGAEVLRKMFLEDVIQRSLNHEIAAAQGLSFGRWESLYAWRHLLSYGQPWCLFLPLALWTVWRDRRLPLGSRTLLLRLSAAWLLAVLGVFTLSRGVWGWYLHSLYVPGALLVGALLEECLAGRDEAPTPALAGLCVAALAVTPMPFAYNPFRDSAANAPLDPLAWQRAAWALALAVSFAALARRERWRAFSLALGGVAAISALGWGLLTRFLLEQTPTPFPLVSLLAPLLAGAVLVDAHARRRLAAGCVSASLILGAAYLLGPLRFAWRDNHRLEFTWVQRVYTHGETVERRASFYSWIVLYHELHDELDVRYDERTQTLRVAPRGGD